MEKWRIIQVWKLKPGTFVSVVKEDNIGGFKEVDYIHESKFDDYGISMEDISNFYGKK